MNNALSPDTVRHHEQRLIVTVTKKPARLAEALSLVRPADILDGYSREVYGILATMLQDRPAHAADPARIEQTIRTKMGPRAVTTLIQMQGNDGTGPVGYLAKHIIEASRRRQLARVLSGALHTVTQDETAPIEGVIADVAMHMNGIVSESVDDDCTAARHARDAEAEHQFRLRSPGLPGVSLGIRGVDNAIGGAQPGKVIVIGARPAMGKSALLLPMLESAEDQHTVGVISLEMEGSEHMARLWCSMARVDARRYDEGQISADERRRIREVQDITRGWGFLIDHRPGLTWTQISGRARQWHARYGLRVLAVDYLQLVRAENPRLPREQQIASISARAKQLARELGITVIMLAQLNRGLENRDDKRPRNSDLRESGALEQDADVIMFIYREIEYADKDGFLPDPSKGRKKRDDSERVDPGRAEIIIRKNRKRATGTVVIQWRAQFTRFEDY